MGVSEIHWYSPKTAIEHRENWENHDCSKTPIIFPKIPMFQIFWSPGAKRRAGVREPAGTMVAAVAAVAAAAGPKETPSPRENSKAPKEKAKDQSLGWIWSLWS